MHDHLPPEDAPATVYGSLRMFFGIFAVALLFWAVVVPALYIGAHRTQEEQR